MTAGNLAAGLGAAWLLFPVAAHPAIWAAYGQDTVHTMARARGWALYFGATLCPLVSRMTRSSPRPDATPWNEPARQSANSSDGGAPARGRVADDVAHHRVGVDRVGATGV